jgi:hypothetical protein
MSNAMHASAAGTVGELAEQQRTVSVRTCPNAPNAQAMRDLVAYAKRSPARVLETSCKRIL